MRLCVYACVGKGEVNYCATRQQRVQHTIKSKNQKAKTNREAKRKSQKTQNKNQGKWLQAKRGGTQQKSTFFCTISADDPPVYR